MKVVCNECRAIQDITPEVVYHTGYNSRTSYIWEVWHFRCSRCSNTWTADIKPVDIIPVGAKQKEDY